MFIRDSFSTQIAYGIVFQLKEIKNLWRILSAYVRPIEICIISKQSDKKVRNTIILLSVKQCRNSEFFSRTKINYMRKIKINERYFKKIQINGSLQRQWFFTVLGF
ncbi:hypothetical protein pb186bvf_008251 [Paramecium bursaria]